MDIFAQNNPVMAYERKIPIDLECGVTIYQIMVGGKWKPYLINCMNRGVCCLVEFQKIIPGATKRVLARQLSEMEQMGLVSKTVYAEVPLRTEYRLTPLGESTLPIIRVMDNWGLEHNNLFDELGQIKM